MSLSNCVNMISFRYHVYETYMFVLNASFYYYVVFIFDLIIMSCFMSDYYIEGCMIVIKINYFLRTRNCKVRNTYLCEPSVINT